MDAYGTAHHLHYHTFFNENKQTRQHLFLSLSISLSS